jgi:hypothetical protein
LITLPHEIAARLAYVLHTLTLSEMPVNFFGFGGTGEAYPAYSSASQQLSVDMIYRCLKCELVTFDSVDWLSDAGFSSYKDFCEELARVDQYKKLDSADLNVSQYNLDMGIWLEPQLYCTSAGEALVSRHFSERGNLEAERALDEFNQDVSQIFSDCGVPWSDQVLIFAGK